MSCNCGGYLGPNSEATVCPSGRTSARYPPPALSLKLVCSELPVRFCGRTLLLPCSSPLRGGAGLGFGASPLLSSDAERGGVKYVRLFTEANTIMKSLAGSRTPGGNFHMVGFLGLLVRNQPER